MPRPELRQRRRRNPSRRPPKRPRPPRGASSLSSRPHRRRHHRRHRSLQLRHSRRSRRAHRSFPCGRDRPSLASGTCGISSASRARSRVAIPNSSRSGRTSSSTCAASPTRMGCFPLNSTGSSAMLSAACSSRRKGREPRTRAAAGSTRRRRSPRRAHRPRARANRPRGGPADHDSSSGRGRTVGGSGRRCDRIRPLRPDNRMRRRTRTRHTWSRTSGIALRSGSRPRVRRRGGSRGSDRPRPVRRTQRFLIPALSGSVFRLGAAQQGERALRLKVRARDNDRVDQGHRGHV